MAEQRPLTTNGLLVRNLCFSPGCRTRRIGVGAGTKDLRIPLRWGTDHALAYRELT